MIQTHIAEFSLRHHLASPDTPCMTPPRSPPLHSQAANSTLTLDITPLSISERTPLLQTGEDPKPPNFVPSSPPTPTTLRSRLFIAVSYASVSGILSGMCLLFAKSGVELLILSAKGKNQFWRWEAWALLGGLVVFALLQVRQLVNIPSQKTMLNGLQLWYLHKSLILANPILVCPCAQNPAWYPFLD